MHFFPDPFPSMTISDIPPPHAPTIPRTQVNHDTHRTPIHPHLPTRLARSIRSTPPATSTIQPPIHSPLDLLRQDIHLQSLLRLLPSRQDIRDSLPAGSALLFHRMPGSLGHVQHCRNLQTRRPHSLIHSLPTSSRARGGALTSSQLFSPAGSGVNGLLTRELKETFSLILRRAIASGVDAVVRE